MNTRRFTYLLAALCAACAVAGFLAGFLAGSAHASPWHHRTLKPDGEGHEIALRGSERFAVKINGHRVDPHGISKAGIHAVVLLGAAPNREFLEYATDEPARLTFRALPSHPDPDAVDVVVAG